MTRRPRIASPVALKRQTPWPLERAQLIRAHESRVNDMRAKHSNELAYATNAAYERGIASVARSFGNDHQWQKHTYNAAMDKLSLNCGEALAMQIDKAFKPYDVRFEMRKRLLDHTLSVAKLGVSVDRLGSETFVTYEIYFDPHRQGFRFILPEGI